MSEMWNLQTAETLVTDYGSTDPSYSTTIKTTFDHSEESSGRGYEYWTWPDQSVDKFSTSEAPAIDTGSDTDNTYGSSIIDAKMTTISSAEISLVNSNASNVTEGLLGNSTLSTFDGNFNLSTTNQTIPTTAQWTSHLPFSILPADTRTQGHGADSTLSQKSETITASSKTLDSTISADATLATPLNTATTWPQETEISISSEEPIDFTSSVQDTEITTALPNPTDYVISTEIYSDGRDVTSYTTFSPEKSKVSTRPFGVADSTIAIGTTEMPAATDETGSTTISSNTADHSIYPEITTVATPPSNPFESTIIFERTSDTLPYSITFTKEATSTDSSDTASSATPTEEQTTTALLPSTNLVISTEDGRKALNDSQETSDFPILSGETQSSTITQPYSTTYQLTTKSTTVQVSEKTTTYTTASSTSGPTWTSPTWSSTINPTIMINTREFETTDSSYQVQETTSEDDSLLDTTSLPTTLTTISNFSTETTAGYNAATTQANLSNQTAPHSCFVEVCFNGGTCVLTSQGWQVNWIRFS